MSIPTTFTHVSSGQNANIDVFYKGRIYIFFRDFEKLIYNCTNLLENYFSVKRQSDVGIIRIFRFFTSLVCNTRHIVHLKRASESFNREFTFLYAFILLSSAR